MSARAVTLQNQIDELKRELAMRERLYPQWIDKGTLTQDKADKQVAALRASLELIEELQANSTSYPATITRMRTVEGLTG